MYPVALLLTCVCVTELQPLISVKVSAYVPAVETRMDDEVSPVLHCNLPVAEVDKVVLLSQFTTAVTDGGAGSGMNMAVTSKRSVLSQPDTDSGTEPHLFRCNCNVIM